MIPDVRPDLSGYGRLSGQFRSLGTSCNSGANKKFYAHGSISRTFLPVLVKALMVGQEYRFEIEDRSNPSRTAV